MTSQYRVRAYQSGKGEICCCSTVSFEAGRQDVARILRDNPASYAKVEKRDPRAATGWTNVYQRAN